MEDNNIDGYGFVNENFEILCIHRNKEDKIEVYATPWREAKATDVILNWNQDIKTILDVIETVWIKDLDLSKFEPIAITVNRVENKLWIG